MTVQKYIFNTPAACAVADQLESLDALWGAAQSELARHGHSLRTYYRIDNRLACGNLFELRRELTKVFNNHYHLESPNAVDIINRLLTELERMKGTHREESDRTKSSGRACLPLPTVYDKKTGAAVSLDDIPHSPSGDARDDLNELPDYCTLAEVFKILDLRLKQLRKTEKDCRQATSECQVALREWQERDAQGGNYEA
jgi:hypothetical protein